MSRRAWAAIWYALAAAHAGGSAWATTKGPDYRLLAAAWGVAAATIMLTWVRRNLRR